MIFMIMITSDFYTVL